MLKRISIMILASVVALSLVSCKKNDDSLISSDTETTVTYKTAQELTDAFMSACKDGDIESVYDMYYDDMLMDTYERIKGHVTKEQFDSMLTYEMMSFTDYELFEYGCEEMPATVSPLYYVNYLFYGSTGSDTDFTEDMVTSCANLRVYANNNGTDHMLAEINGAWYIVL